jgi:SLOG in TRPM, prokaryote/Protein of unknown function (DUF4231)
VRRASSERLQLDVGVTGSLGAPGELPLELSIGKARFPRGSTARMVFASREASVEDVVHALDLGVPPGVVVLAGGTRDFPVEIQASLAPLLSEGLAKVVSEEGLTTITGATDAGVFALFGAGLEERRSPVTIGVAPAALVTWPGRVSGVDDAAPLEPHHSHFVLTDGDEWGDELPTMTRLAALLADERPSLMVLAGGGDVARLEFAAHVGAGREVIVLGGSGRLADEVAAVVGGAPGHPAVVAAVETGLVSVFDVRRRPDDLRSLIRSRLQPRSRRGLTRPKPPALLKRFPLPRYRPQPDYPLVKDEDRAAAQLLDAELAYLEEKLVPRFRSLDDESLRAQHRFRFGIVVLILGSAAATALGSVQAALGGGELGIGIAEGVVGALVAGTVVYVRGRRFQQTYFTKRVVAERLKSQYYLFLARAGTYAVEDDAQRFRLLERTLNRIEAGDEVQ